LGVYDEKPKRFLERVLFSEDGNPTKQVSCAGFELQAWRCDPFADHLIEWLPEYALAEDELHVSHANMYVRLKQAAIRVYTSEKYEKRGEVGEIAIHAICRDFFHTTPISPRVFYKSTSNDVVKAFDMVHARFPESGAIELWLGESKLYEDPARGIVAAIKTVNDHLEAGFLSNQKLLLGPQIPKSTPRYDEVQELFQPQTSLDKLLAAATFVIGIVGDSGATKSVTAIDDRYRGLLTEELGRLERHIEDSELPRRIRIVLLYVPLATKAELVSAFDRKLKGLQT
jgi:hypothetical protein